MKTLTEIGFVKSSFDEPANPTEMKKHISFINIKKEFEEGLFKIEDSIYIDVVFGFNKSEGFDLKLNIFTGERKGVFASRSPRRPNSLAITTVKLIERNGCELKVTGLDALNNSPVFDIKPCDNSLIEKNSEAINASKLKSNPRKQIISHILAGETDKLLIKAAQMHGHYCPGLAMGVMAATFAMQKIKFRSDGMEDLIVITETNNCVSDGIQFVTGCSFGNNALIFKDFGKTAFTISKRDGKGIRISTLPDSQEYIRQAKGKFSSQFEKVIKKQNHSDQEIALLKKLGIESAFAILKLDFDKIFKVEEIEVEIPSYAPSYESIFCETCGESIMASRIINKNEKKLCIPCANESYFQLDGHGISEIRK
ncbi:MAG: SAM-dependent methyltransferase [Bacteroidales bacterium]|nr:SAM-dependent methyltransferase [Bacteroidales bacterium]